MIDFYNNVRTPLRWPPIWWLAGGGVIIMIHLWTVNYFSVNVPFMDDFTFLVDVIHWKKGEKSWQQFLNILFTPHGPHNEHMLVFGRLTALFDYLLEGQLNIKSMIWVGNALLIATFLLLVYMARRAGLTWFQTVPVLLLLFQPQYHEVTMTWAICAVQHLPALFLAFLSFCLLTSSSSAAFRLSFPIALLAYFSNGNGIAVLVSGFVLLLVGGTLRRLYVWVSFSMLVILLARYLASVHGAATDLTNVTHPIRLMGGFLLLSGSVGVLFTRSLIGLTAFGVLLQWLFGTVAVIVLVGVINSGNKTVSVNPENLVGRAKQSLFRWFKQLPVPYRVKHAVAGVLPLLACYLYVLVTLAGIAFARSTGWPYGLLVPRFIWFATMLIVMGYLLVMVAIAPAFRGRVGMLLTLSGLVFYLFSYWYTLDEVMNRYKSLESDMHNWREDELLVSVPPDERVYDRYYSLIIKEAVTLGVYRLPFADFNHDLDRNAVHVDRQMRLVQEKCAFTYVQRHHLRLTLTSPILPSPVPGMDNMYLLLRSATHTFVWPVDQSPVKLAYFLINGRAGASGNVVTLYTDLLPVSAYQLGLLYKKDACWYSVYSQDSIVIDHGYQPRSKEFPNIITYVK